MTTAPTTNQDTPSGTVDGRNAEADRAPSRDPEGRAAAPEVGPRVTLGMLVGIVAAAVVLAAVAGIALHPLAGFAIVAIALLMFIFNPAILAAVLRSKADDRRR